MMTSKELTTINEDYYDRKIYIATIEITNENDNEHLLNRKILLTDKQESLMNF